MKPRRLKSSLALFLVTVIAGLAVRMAPLGLPTVLVKYGGSMLWAVMIYWVVSTALARWRLPVVGLAAGAVATAVEFFKLYHSPGMDAFRLTLPGMILLGRYFLRAGHRGVLDCDWRCGVGRWGDSAGGRLERGEGKSCG